LKRYNKEDPRIEEVLAGEYPDIHEARCLFEDVAGARWVFEAGVMARQTVEFMAEYLNADIEVLKTYEKLFFDVRDALDHKGCIHASILHPAVSAGAPAGDPDYMWKLVAYEGGWEAVKSIWEIGEISPVAMDFIVRTFREQTMKVAQNTVFSIQPNSFNSTELIGKGIEMLKLEAETENLRGANQSEASIAALLGAVAISVRESKDAVVQVEPRRSLPDASSIFAISREKIEAEEAEREKAVTKAKKETE
jgi:hypothetical protein